MKRKNKQTKKQTFKHTVVVGVYLREPSTVLHTGLVLFATFCSVVRWFCVTFVRHRQVAVYHLGVSISPFFVNCSQACGSCCGSISVASCHREERVWRAGELHRGVRKHVGLVCGRDCHWVRDSYLLVLPRNSGD